MVVRGEHISKVKVAILAHGHPLILFDVQDLCGQGGGAGRKEAEARGQRSGALPREHTPTDPSLAPGGSPSWAPTAVHPVDPEWLCTGGRVARENHRLPFLDLNRFHCLLWPLGGTWKGQRGWPRGFSSLFLEKAGQGERRRATRGHRLASQDMREAETLDPLWAQG